MDLPEMYCFIYVQMELEKFCHSVFHLDLHKSNKTNTIQFTTQI